MKWCAVRGGGIFRLDSLETRQGELHRLDVAIDDDLPAFSVGLADLLDHSGCRMPGLDQVREREETRLQHDVDPTAETQRRGDAARIDRPDLQFELGDAGLHPGRKLVPDLVGRVRRVEEQGRPRRRHLEDVEFLEQIELMASDEAGLIDEVVIYAVEGNKAIVSFEKESLFGGLIDQIAGSNRTWGEPEMGDGHRSRLLRVVHEVALGVEVSGVTDDLDGRLVRANGAIRAQTEEDCSEHVVWLRGALLGFGKAQLGHVVDDPDGERLHGALGGHLTLSVG